MDPAIKFDITVPRGQVNSRGLLCKIREALVVNLHHETQSDAAVAIDNSLRSTSCASSGQLRATSGINMFAHGCDPPR
jgi:hypothetical protein